MVPALCGLCPFRGSAPPSTSDNGVMHVEMPVLAMRKTRLRNVHVKDKTGDGDTKKIKLVLLQGPLVVRQRKAGLSAG